MNRLYIFRIVFLCIGGLIGPMQISHVLYATKCLNKMR